MSTHLSASRFNGVAFATGGPGGDGGSSTATSVTMTLSSSSARGDDVFAGIVVWSWVSTSGPRGCVQIGILLLPEHRGCGVGTAAQLLLAEYLFAHTTANRLEATTGIDNTAEQHALEKAGFTREGLLRGRGWGNGEWRDGYMYARLRADPPPA